MTNSKAYVEGWDYAVKCCDSTYEQNDIGIFWKDRNFYIKGKSKRQDKQFKDFEIGKKAAFTWMKEQNKKSIEAESLLIDSGDFDAFIEEIVNMQNVILGSENAEELKEYQKLYELGACALQEFYKKVRIRDLYSI